MHLTNTSKYPDADVRTLVAFGMKGVNTDHLEVHVKRDRTGAIRGMAYLGVPSMAAVHPASTALVTLGIGAARQFPTDNLVETTRWHEWQELRSETAHPEDGEWKSETRYGADGKPSLIRYGEVISHPYGGVRSPLIVMRDWREALLAVAAHEARHVWQRQHRKRMSEVDAERHALRRLTAYRED